MSNYLESTAIDPACVIDDDTPLEAVNNGGQGFGYVARDVDQYPVFGAPPSEIKDIPPMEEWPAICEETEAKQANLFHVRNRCGPGGGMMPQLVQGRYGYCWAHSAVHALMLQLFGNQQQPYEPLSAFSIAGLIMDGRNQGGWAALAFDHMMKVGCGPQSVPEWKQPSDPFLKVRPDANPRLWTPENRAIAAKFKVLEGWWDAGKHPGLRKLSMPALFKLCMVDFVPCPVEFNWEGHSTCLLRFVDLKNGRKATDYGRYGIDRLDSNLTYPKGVGRITGNRMFPDSTVALTSASAG